VTFNAADTPTRSRRWLGMLLAAAAGVVGVALWVVTEPNAVATADHVAELVERRELRRVSQASLARLTGLRRNAIRELKAGQSYPDWTTVARLAYALARRQVRRPHRASRLDVMRGADSPVQGFNHSRTQTCLRVSCGCDSELSWPRRQGLPSRAETWSCLP
jgi:DNA-binding XRE family transcriptional regulator